MGDPYLADAPAARFAGDELAGRLIGVTAERRSHQQQRFLVARGANTLMAPVLQTIDGAERPQLVAVADDIVASPPDILVVQTGQGLRWWIDGLPASLAARLVPALGGTEVWCRGIKAASACRKAGVRVDWQAPNESAADIASRLRTEQVESKRIVVQLDGNSDNQLLETAESHGAVVIGLDVYRYRLPDDRRPIARLIAGVIDGRVDAVTFTASPQIRHLRLVAEELGCGTQLDGAFRASCLAAVVGPVCAETARSAGWANIVEPSTARLMPMLEALRLALLSD